MFYWTDFDLHYFYREVKTSQMKMDKSDINLSPVPSFLELNMQFMDLTTASLFNKESQ